MEISGWGRYPRVEADVLYPQTRNELQRCLEQDRSSLIPMGMGRSYGDSALADTVVNTRYLDHFIEFDQASGVLTCNAGATLAAILDVFVPRGWFLPVTPGTKFVTVGGAIASDVHGKNHHLEGSFADHLLSLKILTVAEGVVECSPTKNVELFRATCGGMGLTGCILEATFKLKAITSSQIDTTTCKARNLDHALELFRQYRDATYSVAWIDCLAKGDHLGRSLVSIGEHARGTAMAKRGKGKLAIPVDMPSWLLNTHSIRAFNELYYRKQFKDIEDGHCHYDSFFYPLDGIHSWNRLYGKKGFLQYQCVLPDESAAEGLKTILKQIANAGKGSFLAVLKAFGPGNDNYLSFPMKGLTLALDFKREPSVFPLLDELDRVVVDCGGRHYLAKDARVSQQVFKQGYPKWEKFCEVRRLYGADKLYNSLQSRRLGL